MAIDDDFESATTLRDNGDINGAIRLLLPWAESQVQSPAIYAVLGGLYMKLQQPQLALLHFREASRLAPDCEVASLGVFHCLWEMGRQMEALDEMKRYLQTETSEEYSRILEAINKEN